VDVAFNRCQKFASAYNLVPPESEDDFEEIIVSLFDAFDTNTGLDGDLFDIDQDVINVLEEGFRILSTSGESEDTSRTVVFGVKMVDPEEEDTSFLTDVDPKQSAGGAAFIANHLVSNPDGALPSSATYDEYVDTATEWGFETIPDRGPSVTFKRFLQIWGAALLGVSVERKRRRIDGSPTRCYTHLEWRE